MRCTCVLVAASLVLCGAGHGATLRTTDGLRISCELPARLGPLVIDDKTVSLTVGSLVLTDPRTSKAPVPGAFTIQSQAAAAGKRIVLSGLVKAAGDTETVCQLQAFVPVGEEGWLYWDDMSRSRPIVRGNSYLQSVYPLACVTSPDRRTGLAVGVDPEPVQPATLSYDVAARALVVTWRLGFTPLARPELRMQAPFRIELWRLQPGWAFRSALSSYYAFHPARFDWRARYEGLWEFATDTVGLPNPQHYAYNEGGPPPSFDRPRGIHTFPYTCTGDLVVALPPEWGVPKTYEEMLDRLDRWSKIPRLPDWDKLSDYTVVTDSAHSGQQSLQFRNEDAKGERSVRQTIVLAQKKPEPVTVSVWTRAQDVTGGSDSNYGLWLDLLMADGTFQFGKTAPAPVGTHDWQRLSLTVGEDKPIQEIRLYLLLRGGHTGTAWFDDVSVATTGQAEKNLTLTPGFESTGPPPEVQYLHDNVMHDQNDHMRYYADSWGGADVGPASPINWLRFWTLVNPDQRNPAGRQTEAEKDLARIAAIFKDNPDCAGIYMDGTSACTTVTYEYRHDFFPCFRDPFMYEPGVNRVCANGMASVMRYVDEYKRRFPGKLAFGNVWASNRLFQMGMALDVPGYESSRWYDLEYADYYRAALYHKPGPYLNYFRISQQLDTREGGERFFRYATAYGIFPSIGRFTDEAYEKFGDLQHLYIPIVKHLFRAGWEPVTYAETDDPEVRLQRYGTALPLHFALLNPTANPRTVRLSIEAAALHLPAGLEAVDMATSAAVPLRKAGDRLVTEVALGPQDVAVIALLPQGGLGAWYRLRAAEILQGAAYVYAQTPPTVACVALAERVRTLKSAVTAAAVATSLGEVKQALTRLQGASEQLPADLKRTSYRRELAEATRLITEALLADTGVRVGWEGKLVAPADSELSVQVRQWVVGGKPASLTRLGSLPGRIVEPDEAQSTAVADPAAGLRLRKTANEVWGVTTLACLEFSDATGQPAKLVRRGYGYFGAISELRAAYEPADNQIAVRLHNLDATSRQLQVVLTAPAGITLTPSTLDVSLAGGQTRAMPVKIVFAASLPAGTYPVQLAARLADGTPLDQTSVSLSYVLPLEPGDLALAAAGAQVVVDSAYYAYSEKPISDGQVNPVGLPFNQAAWAAAESPGPHWAQFTWPGPQRVGRVVIYWNVEDERVWTSQQVQVQVKEGEAWRTVAEVKPAAVEPVSVASFAPVSTSAVRLWQPQGQGPATRPHIMWLREVAVYAQ